MSVVATASSKGVDFHIELERQTLLPGNAAAGTVTLTPRKTIDVRGCRAALIATEQWKYERRRHGQNGGTETVTDADELQRLPVMLSGPTTLSAGESRTIGFEVPVPPLGPATFEGNVSRLTWELEVKLDVPLLDPAIVVPMVVLQPTALLRAGVVPVDQYALYESVDVSDGAMRASVTLRPMPLCLGMPFEGAVRLSGALPSRLEEVRLELRVRAEATVSNGLEETMTVWKSVLPVPTSSATDVIIDSSLPQAWLPTIALPHGRSEAVFDIVLARSLAPDDHLRRDVALCSTTEI